MNCKDCGLEMKSDKQGELIILTCFNKACTLWSVTLTEDVYKSLTEDQLNNYRKMVANLKKRFQS